MTIFALVPVYGIFGALWGAWFAYNHTMSFGPVLRYSALFPGAIGGLFIGSSIPILFLLSLQGLSKLVRYGSKGRQRESKTMPGLQKPSAIRVWVKHRNVHVELSDGRIAKFSADQFPSLRIATDDQLRDLHFDPFGFTLRCDGLEGEIEVSDIIHFLELLPAQSDRNTQTDVIGNPPDF